MAPPSRIPAAPFDALAARAAAARELDAPREIAEVEQQLRTTQWPASFGEQRFLTLRALGFARALRGEYFEGFRALRDASRFATSDAWRAVVAAERAEIAAARGENLWARQEFADAQEFAARADWKAASPEARLGLLSLANLCVALDAGRPAAYRDRYLALKGEALPPPLSAMAQYALGALEVAGERGETGLERVRAAMAAFAELGYDWRCGRCALLLYEHTRNRSNLSAAREKLRHYMKSWLGDELRRLSERRAALPPMQRRVYDALCKGLSNAEIARELGRSEFTVRNHVKLIFKAFGVNSRAELIAKSLDRLGKRGSLE